MATKNSPVGAKESEAWQANEENEALQQQADERHKWELRSVVTIIPQKKNCKRRVCERRAQITRFSREGMSAGQIKRRQRRWEAREGCDNCPLKKRKRREYMAAKNSLVGAKESRNKMNINHNHTRQKHERERRQ
jgi:hypothetical protein